MTAARDAAQEREGRPCTYCGETDAWPRHFCLTRMTQAMGPTPAPFACSYSVEGCERIAASLAETSRKIGATKRRALAADTQGGRGDGER